MDYRTQTFREKFSAAAQVLGVAPHQIVSLKVRETVNSYAVYHEFFDRLAHEAELRCQPVNGNFQGHGFTLTRGKTTVIAVEHETGLELLYIAGSIASLLSLVPLVLQGWRAFRNHRPGRNRDGPLELRRLDEAGNLVEEPVQDFPRSPHADPLATLVSGALESEFRRLTERVDALTIKIAALEKKTGRTRKTRRSSRRKH